MKDKITKCDSTSTFQIFSFLSAFELIHLKTISSHFKLMSEKYLGKTSHQIFYAVSPSSTVEVGTQTMQGHVVKKNFVNGVSTSALLYAFKEERDCRVWLYRTEEQALTSPFANTMYFKHISYEEEGVIEKQKILVPPIYKVQLVHASITSYEYSTNTHLVKELNEHPDRFFLVKKSNLLPLSASVKFKFFPNNPLNTITENQDLKQIEPEVKSEQKTDTSKKFRKCSVM